MRDYFNAVVGLITLMTGLQAKEDLSLPSPQTLEQEYGYLSLGLGPFPIPLPVFGGGYRMQWGHHGFDASLQVSTLVIVTQLKSSLIYHYYFNPSLESQFYTGVGVGPSYLFSPGKGVFLFSPEWVFGKQYRSEGGSQRFFQVQVSFPTIGFSEGITESTCFPLVVFSYGIGF